VIAFQNKQTGGRDRGNRRSQGKGDLRGNWFPLFFDLAHKVGEGGSARKGREGRDQKDRAEREGGGRRSRVVEERKETRDTSNQQQFNV
jgi:hypothetical protein